MQAGDVSDLELGWQKYPHLAISLSMLYTVKPGQITGTSNQVKKKSSGVWTLSRLQPYISSLGSVGSQYDIVTV